MIQKDFLSINAQSRPDYLKAKADAYFDYDWLFQLLWTEFKNDVAKTASANFCDNLQQQRQKRFIWAFIESHRSSLNEIKETYENLFGDQNFALELYEQRLALIDKFCENPLSLRWKHVYQSPKQKKPNNSWQIFADNLKFGDPKSEAEIKDFLYLLDKICLITDILTRRDEYGFKYSLSTYKRTMVDIKPNKTNEPPRDFLIQAIKQHEDLFKTQTAWAVVYVLCREDYDIPENRSLFDRYAQDLLSDPVLEKFKQGCPSGTIQSAFTGKKGSGEFFNHHSSEWVILGGYDWAIDLLAKLRRAIESLELEKKAEEQKEMYKLSLRGF